MSLIICKSKYHRKFLIETSPSLFPLWHYTSTPVCQSDSRTRSNLFLTLNASSHFRIKVDISVQFIITMVLEIPFANYNFLSSRCFQLCDKILRPSTKCFHGYFLNFPYSLSRLIDKRTYIFLLKKRVQILLTLNLRIFNKTWQMESLF